MYFSRLFCCFLAFFFISVLISCQEDIVSHPEAVVYYNDFPVRDEYKSGWEKFSENFAKDSNYVNEFDLTIQKKDYYKSNSSPLSTLNGSSKMILNQDLEVHFFPLNQDTATQFQYIYKFECIKDPKNYRYADVAYPNPCQGKDLMAKARAFLVNKTGVNKRLYCRLFYQNNSYAYSTGKDVDFDKRLFLTNYYGASKSYIVDVAANQNKEVFLDYLIGKDPKKEDLLTKSFYGPARPGNYEFMLWVTEDSTDILVDDSLNLRQVNPFANFQERLQNGESSVLDNVAHTHAKHFKFVFLHETFNGDNIYNPGTVYLLGDRSEKPLCDTCTGYFRDIIADEWTPDDYFNGFISQAPWIKAEYGNRKENVRIDEYGVYLKCPKSTPEKKQKTWGEIKFAPGFLYGTVKIVAKFPQLRNTKTHSPTGIVHNLWLYQFNHPYAEAISGHPYEYLKNDKGKQPYEIDIEIWSKIYSENWSGGAGINYSIVDYMRNENVVVKPGEQKKINGYDIDRFNNIQLNHPDRDLYWHDFWEQYHQYEIIWSPQNVKYKIDGRLVATIDESLAKIPDEYAFLWIGSPIYQDGTYYGQNGIPFLPDDRFSHIRYISIE